LAERRAGLFGSLTSHRMNDQCIEPDQHLNSAHTALLYDLKFFSLGKSKALTCPPALDSRGPGSNADRPAPKAQVIGHFRGGIGTQAGQSARLRCCLKGP
jgi:hypothetical protein